MHKVQAKFRVNFTYKTPDDKVQVVHANAVYSSDKNDPNYSWSEATPGGSLSMTISNPDAQNFFSQGDEFYLDFTKAESKP